MKIKAEQIMHEIIMTGPNTSIIDSIKIMDKNNIGSLIISADNEVFGIVTEEDVLRYVSENTDYSRKISEIMTTVVYTVEFDCDIDEISRTLQEYHIRRLGVTKNGKIVGILTSKDVVTKYYTVLLKAEDIMEKADFVEKDISVKDAVLVMDKRIGCVFIKDKDLGGIVTEKDILNKVILKGIDYNKITIRSIMSKIDKSIESYMDLNDVMNVFHSNYIKRLPVIKNNEVIGVVTTVNLLKHYHSSLVKAGDLMKTPVFISPEISLKEAARSIILGMSEFAIVSRVCEELSVEKNNVLGIVTERDILRSISKNQDLDKVKISEIMTKNLQTVDVDEGINRVLGLFKEHNIRRLPVTKSKYVVGMLSISDLMWPYYISNVSVENIMKEPIFEDPDKSASDIVKTMSSNSIGSVLIEKNKEVLGIITEEDIIHRIIKEGLDPSKVKASEIMTKSIHTADFNMDINRISELFDKYKVRRIPVTKSGKISGIITPRSFF